MENTYQKIIAQNISKLRKEAELSELTFATKADIDPKHFAPPNMPTEI